MVIGIDGRNVMCVCQGLGLRLLDFHPLGAGNFWDLAFNQSLHGTFP